MWLFKVSSPLIHQFKAVKCQSQVVYFLLESEERWGHNLKNNIVSGSHCVMLMKSKTMTCISAVRNIINLSFWTYKHFICSLLCTWTMFIHLNRRIIHLNGLWSMYTSRHHIFWSQKATIINLSVVKKWWYLCTKCWCGGNEKCFLINYIYMFPYMHTENWNSKA